MFRNFLILIFFVAIFGNVESLKCYNCDDCASVNNETATKVCTDLLTMVCSKFVIRGTFLFENSIQSIANQNV
jgi:hypothetical protein